MVELLRSILYSSKNDRIPYFDIHYSLFDIRYLDFITRKPYPATYNPQLALKSLSDGETSGSWALSPGEKGQRLPGA